MKAPQGVFEGCQKIMSYYPAMARKLSKSRPPEGARLVELRQAAGLTQTELASLVGEKQQNIAFWEQSNKPPRSDVIPKLAEALGVDVVALLDAHRSIPKRRSGPVGTVRRLFEEVSRLPRQEQKKVVEFVSAFVDHHRRLVG
jgi:transcriptional regulator with XRE-family HTH domain